ncbi:hypothetical protein MCERH10_00832 [Caulobacteraceae bacterium]
MCKEYIKFWEGVFCEFLSRYPALVANEQHIDPTWARNDRFYRLVGLFKPCSWVLAGRVAQTVDAEMAGILAASCAPHLKRGEDRSPHVGSRQIAAQVGCTCAIIQGCFNSGEESIREGHFTQ